jgi:hypothetical protein
VGKQIILDSAVKESQVVQMAESARHFSFFALNPGAIRGERETKKPNQFQSSAPLGEPQLPTLALMTPLLSVLSE